MMAVEKGGARADAANEKAPHEIVLAAIADPDRPEEDLREDAIRLPAELLEFSTIKPGDTVLEVWPGKGYWTRIFSAVAGPDGRVRAFVPSEIADMKAKPVELAQAVANEPSRANVTVDSSPLAAAPSDDQRNTVDVCWTFENYHDLFNRFMKGADVTAFNRAIFDVLKPGGYFVIADHAAESGTGLDHTNDLHRIDPAAVENALFNAGFVLDGESDVLADKDDDHTRPSVEPYMHGRTDRFLLRFWKPAD